MFYIWLIIRMMLALCALVVISASAFLVAGRAQPDPGQVVVLARDERSAGIFVIDAQRANRTALFTMPPIQSADIPRLSSHGHHIVFETFGTGGLGVFALNDHRDVLYITEPSLEDRLPSWSPDGTQLAFWSNRVSPNIRARRWQNWNFYLLDMTTNTVRQITDILGILPFNIPLWSPDGKRIIISYWRPTMGARMYILDVERGDLTNVQGAIETGSDLVWSPTGDSIAFRSNPGGNGEIVILDLATGELNNFTNHPATDFEPAWSPDGAHIAFTSNRTGSGEIYVMDVNGGNTRQLTTGGGWHPAWSPSGEHIAFISNRDRRPSYYVINTDGSHLRYIAPVATHFLLGWYSHNS
jgi:TolB protein